MARIYIVEDDESIGALIEATLNAAAHETWLFPDAAHMEDAAAQEKPDLLLLDIMLPGKNGWEILDEWKKDVRTSRIPVIVLSAKGGELDKVRGLEAGAEDYITKPFGVLELQSRVKAALRRVENVASGYSFGDITVDVRARQVRRKGEPVYLTHKEMELLEYLCRNAGMALSREQLLTGVWGNQFDADTTRTVDYHIMALRQKLEGGDEGARYIETVRGYGYRLKKE